MPDKTHSLAAPQSEAAPVSAAPVSSGGFNETADTEAVFYRTDLLESAAEPLPSRTDAIEETLRQLSGDAAHGAERVDLLNELAWSLRRSDTKRALDIGGEAYQLAQSVDYQKGGADSLRNVGVCLYFLSNYRAALTNLTEALQLFITTGDRAGTVGVMSWIGGVHHRLGEYKQALEYFDNSLVIAKQIGDDRAYALALCNLGGVYESLGDYTQALTYSRQSLPLLEIYQDKRGIATALTHIGNASEKLGDYSSALTHHLSGLALYRSIDDKRGESRLLNSVGNVYVSLGDHQEAFDFFLRSLQIKEDIGDRQGEAESLACIGDVSHKLGDYEQAQSYHLKSLMIREDIGDLHGVAESYASLSAVLQSTGDLVQSMNYCRNSLKKFEDLNDREGEAEMLTALAALIVRQLGQDKSLDHLGLNELFANKGDADLAKAHLDKALALSESLGTKPRLYRAHQVYADLYKALGDSAKALEHYETFFRIKQDVFSAEMNSKLTTLQMSFATERAEKEAEIYRLKTVELGRMNGALREANELKIELLGIAAHDLKNPLTSIMTSIELIREQSEDKELVEELTQAIYASSERMLNLIRDLLDTAAIESGKINLKIQPFDLSRLTEQVISHNTQQAAAKHITVNFESTLTSAAATVTGDINRLREVIDNLVSNAIKYSPPKKQVWVSVSKQPSGIRVEVRDEGQGLSADDMTRLFGKFQRLSSKPTGGESSSGLGLSIVKQLVELHGGAVWAESAGKEKGSSFIVELPVSSN